MNYNENISKEEMDQRQKRILINENGKKFLMELQKFLNPF